jgi:biotin carboxylase
VAHLALVLPSQSYRGDDFVRAGARHELTIVTDATEPLGGPAVVVSTLASDEDEIARVTGILHRRRVEAVLGVDELSIRFASLLSDRLGLTQGRAAVIERATRKDLLRAALEAAEIAQPDWVRIEDPSALDAEWLGRALGKGPWVLKPIDRTASEGVVRIDAETIGWGIQQVRAVVGPDRPILAERYVDGPEVALEGILTAGNLEVVEIFDKPDIGDGPTFWEETYLAPSTIATHERREAVAVVERAARVLGLDTSPIHAELRFAQGHAVLLELAPRTIGGRCARAIRLEDGRRLEDLVIERVVTGEQRGALRRGGPVGIWMIRTPTDGIFEGLDGLEEARTLPGVEAVEITTAPGTPVFAPPRTRTYLGFVFVRGQRRSQVLARLEEVRQHLQPRIVPAA